MNRLLTKWFTLWMVFLLAPSCAYRFPSDDQLSLGIRRIGVFMFENRTSETGVEILFTRHLIDELSKSGRIKVVRQQQASAFLRGIIKSLDINTISRADSYTAVERKITIYVDLRIEDGNGKMVWSADDVMSQKTYQVMPDKLETEQNKREAIAEISRKIAQNTFNRLFWDH